MKERKRWPKGMIKQVAAEVGCTPQYAWMVLSGYKVPDTLLAKRLQKRAADILNELKVA